MSKADELLLDVLFQACGDGGEIDNACTRPYEDACEYLAGRGMLIRKNDRIYKLVKL